MLNANAERSDNRWPPGRATSSRQRTTTPAEFDDDAIPADGILLQRGGTGPAGESIVMETGQAPSLYVVIHNIKSSDNVGQLIRTAGAFGAREVLVVSAERTARRMRKNLRTFGAHGSDKRVPMRAFASLAQLDGMGPRPRLSASSASRSMIVR